MMLRIRRPVEKDFDTIFRLAEKHDFHMPYDFTHGAVVTDEQNNFVAVGLISYLSEATILCTGSPRTRIESIDLLLEQGINDVFKSGSNQIYVLVNDARFERIVKKRWKFHDAIGKLLILDF